jgi:hypothetical protein
MARKRAPGGGKKPKGEFAQLTSPLSVRMPASLRDELEAAASESGRSVSQELLRRVQDSFHRDRDKRRDSALRALCYLLAEVVEIVSDAAWSPPDARRQWQSDPFVFRATKLAFSKLLDMLEPKGEIRPRFSEKQIRAVWPADLVEQALAENESPVAKADFAAGFIWRRLHSPSPLSDEEKELVRDASKRDLESTEVIRRKFENWSYGMSDAANDLGLRKGSLT